ncbi:unannotated protein [freshwater metagenome]|uniref:Unannotated protein n=1 Tax=freshwater metagenome TaxID=449393 RepID=A0A6J7H5U6_9ZZZZ
MTDHHLDDIWRSLSRDLHAAVGDSLFDMWLAGLEPIEFDGRVLTLAASVDVQAWVADRFGGILDAVCESILGPGTCVRLVVSSGSAAAGSSSTAVTAPLVTEPAPVSLNPKYVFDQFVIGAANRFAHAAALAVAENPGTSYNPLLLCGPPGVGKTHLLHAIGNYLTRHENGMRVRVTTGEAFANEFIAALRSKRIEVFKARHREVDILLVDDIQFLISKVRTEEEFFHTFNALRDGGAQIVLTTDRSPSELDGLQERLRDRFAAGLVADIRPPDRPTRIAALRKRAQLDGLDVRDPRVLEVIADRATANLRGLEGALVRVVAFASLTGRPLEPALAEEVLDDLGMTQRTVGSRPVTGPSIEEVQSLTCDAFGLTREDLLSPSRAGRISWPRHVAMYLAREHTNASLPVIGEHFGGRGHTTVLHAVRRTAERIATDQEAAELVNSLSAQLSIRGRRARGDRDD